MIAQVPSSAPVAEGVAGQRAGVRALVDDDMGRALYDWLGWTR